MDTEGAKLAHSTLVFQDSEYRFNNCFALRVSEQVSGIVRSGTNGLAPQMNARKVKRETVAKAGDLVAGKKVSLPLPTTRA